MHLTRWITGLAALPFLVYLIIRGGLPFYCLVAVVSLTALWEFFRIVFSGTDRSLRHPVPIAGFILTPLVLLAAHKGSLQTVVALLSMNLIAAALILIVRFKSDRSASELVFFQVTGVSYIALPLSMLVLIRLEPDGIAWIFLVLAIVFAGDTCAYHVGSQYGAHKLCPSVSPGKTLEGSLGGLVGNLAAGALVKGFFLPLLPWVESLAFFVIVGMAGQAGDLFESLLKRQGNIKDSGAILPGHGGILDRIDALLFAAPVAYLFNNLIQ